MDKIGQEGINFLDAHSASTKCSPSRYMLMTGRFSFHGDGEGRSAAVRKLYPGTPHLPDLFKRNGYTTGIVGKTAPILDTFRDDGDKEESKKQMKEFAEFREKLGERLGSGKSKHKQSFYLPANYSMTTGAHTSYDYAFLNQYACCRVGGGYFENGVGVEPFNKFGIQRPYPEGSIPKEELPNGCSEFLSYSGEKRCGNKPFANGYLGPPYTDEKIDGPIYVPNFPPSILVQPSYDSRTIETRIREKALTFIRTNARKKQPFFLYYGFRAGHNPFNSEPRWRGKSKVGEIGEAVMELDYNVGRVMDTLKEYGIE